jgi:hypothetical protein
MVVCSLYFFILNILLLPSWYIYEHFLILYRLYCQGHIKNMLFADFLLATIHLYALSLCKPFIEMIVNIYLVFCFRLALFSSAFDV